MKKSRILAFALIVAVMLVGAGYAAWTDKLTITNTVSTGELSVRFVEPTTVTPTDGYVAATVVPDQIGTDANTKLLTVTMPNMYPGAYVTFNTKFENNGTIPAVITDTLVYSPDETATVTGLNGKTLTKMTSAQQAKVNVTGTIKHMRGTAVVTGHSIDLATNLKDFGTKLNQMKTWRLEKDDYVLFENVKIELPTSVGTTTDVNEMENTYCKFKIELNFKQHNM